jgi:hypothetical protein
MTALSLDPWGLAALGLVVLEWLALGTLSGIRWPVGEAPFWAPRWALRLLVGAVLIAVTQLGLAVAGVGFGSTPVVLVAAALLAGGIRLVGPRHPCATAAPAPSPPTPAPSAPAHLSATESAAPEPSARMPARERTGQEPSARQPAREHAGPEAAATESVGPDAAARMPEREHAGQAASTQVPERERPRLAATRERAGLAATARMGARERVGWLVLGGVLLGATLRALLVPEAGWDAYSHWGLRAQAFALAQTVVDAHSEHEYYPPLVPLLEAWLYLHRGAVSIDLAKSIWAVVGSAFAVCLGWHLRLALNVSRAWLAPWLATAIVLSSTALLENFWTGQADLALAAYLTLATLAVYQAQRAPNQLWLIQAAVFAAAAAFTKFEGLPRIAVLVAALVLEGLLARRWLWAWNSCLALVGGAGCTWIVWQTFELTHRIVANAEHLGPLQPLAIGGVLVSLVAVLGGVRTGGGVLVVGLSWLVGGRCLLLPPLRLLSLVVLGQLAATLIGFLLSDTSPAVAVQTAATRLFEQFIPLALFAGAVALQNAAHAVEAE